MPSTTRLILLVLALMIGAGVPRVLADKPEAQVTMTPRATLDDSRVVTRLAFASCAQQNRPQPAWHAIADLRPDLFVFLGDNVYGDTKDMSKLRADYAKLNAMPGFVRLREQGTGVLAIWDDHDYGDNDVGAEWEMKKQSQAVFHDWLGTPLDSPLRTREGIYASHIFGPEGRRVQVILLDTRTFRSPIPTRGPEPARALGRPGMYTPNTDPSSTLLGPEQWGWLEEQLRLEAQVRVIATSIQFVAEQHHFECWAMFPHERARLIGMVNELRASGVVLISGDRHHAEISRLDPTNSGGSPVYPLWDVTSSALNQTKRWGNEINDHRVGSPYFEENFGLIEIDWEQPDPALSLEVRDEAGATLMKQVVHLSTLRER